MVVRKYKLSTFGETKRLAGIDENLIEPLLFVEKLYVFNEEGKRIGRFSVKIDREEGDNSDHKILYVHISNRAIINGKLSQSMVTGTVTPKLKTLEEIRYEYTEVSDLAKQERSLFLLRETTKYYLSVTNKICDSQSQTQFTIPFVEAIGMMGESANAVLLRILAIKGFEGILCLKTILPNGKKCRNYYVSKLSEQVVNNRKLQLLVVYRNVTNLKKYNITMTFGLTRAGQLIYLFWSNSKYFLHVDPDADILPNRFIYPQPGLQNYWHKDVQLYSLYLDRMDQNRIIFRSFQYENEPLKRIIGDFVEYTLLMKPADIVCFAIKYFTAFGHTSGIDCFSPQAASFKQFGEALNEKTSKMEKSFLSASQSEGIPFGEA